MTPTVGSKWGFILDRNSLLRLTRVAAVGALLLGPGGLTAFAQSQTKPVIQLVATGGTIANTRGGRIPIQQTIADIRKNFPETARLLDSVKFEVMELLRIGCQDRTWAEAQGSDCSLTPAEPQAKAWRACAGTAGIRHSRCPVGDQNSKLQFPILKPET